jgi:hypothetical protein
MGAARIKSTQPFHRVTARALIIAFWCSITLAAWAQSIKIPDFRQPPPQITSAKPGEPCNDCGRILSIREIRLDQRPGMPTALQGDGPGSSAGPVGPNLVGAVIYLPLGGDSPQRPFVGGVGTPEMKERFRESIYEIAVRFDDGSLRFLQRPDGARYQVGDRVRATGAGQLELMAN